MGAYTQIIYHLVFSTKNRQKILYKPERENLFKYISGIIKNKQCLTYAIGGVEDHLHIVSNLHPKVSLSDFVKDIKLASSYFIKYTQLFQDFPGWQIGYGAFTYSIKDKADVINYVNNQEKHHRKRTFREEFIELLEEHGISFDEKFLQ